METKSNHRVMVVRIQETKPHPNADTLCIIPIPGTDYQYVGKIGDLKAGDLAAYIQPDSVVPETPEFSWLWHPRTFDGPVPERYRRITTRRFRKEWSEGLLVKIETDEHTGQGYIKHGSDTSAVTEGMDVAELLGVTHYSPPEDDISTRGDNERGPQYRRFPKSLKGWFYYIAGLLGFDSYGQLGGSNEKSLDVARPVYDVEAFKNFKDAFRDGEGVIVTEKIHGSNARYTLEDGLFGGKMYAGSRKLWKAPRSKCVWRMALEQNPWIEHWCRAYPGYTLYGEVVPTQGAYRYGCADGEVRFFPFDILAPNDEWVGAEAAISMIGLAYATWAPVLYTGPFNLDEIKKLVTGQSRVPGAFHKREGVVIRPVTERHVRGLGRLQLKIVSNEFLEEQTKAKEPRQPEAPQLALAA